MDITKYGRVAVAPCSECCDEAVRHAWESGPPEWLHRYEDGDFGMTVCPEYQLWREQHQRPQPCLVVEMVYDHGRDELLVLCPAHLSALAEQIGLTSNSTPTSGQPN